MPSAEVCNVYKQATPDTRKSCITFASCSSILSQIHFSRVCILNVILHSSAS